MEGNELGRLADSAEKVANSLSKHLSSLRLQSWLKTGAMVAVIGLYLFLSLTALKPKSTSLNLQPTNNTLNNLNASYLKFVPDTKDKVIVISVDGVIMEADKNGKDLISNFAAKLKAANDDPNVKAVILEVKSPGGSVNASDLMWQELKEFKNSKKPLVAYFNGLAASGGYYISMQADKILATPATITGSIGVIAQVPNFSKLLDKIGVEMITVKSGARKDMLSPYKPMDPEDQKIFQSLIDNSYNRFVKLVSEGRKMDETKVRSLADGRIYNADDALANGLIDNIGYMNDAFKLAKELAKIEKASLVRYEVRPDLLLELFGQFAKNPVINIDHSLISKTLQLYYLPPNTLAFN